jgi:hypothetical protein
LRRVPSGDARSQGAAVHVKKGLDEPSRTIKARTRYARTRLDML